RTLAAPGVVASGAPPSQRLGGRAAHGLLEVHRAAPADTRSRTRIPSDREQLAGSPGEARRHSVAGRCGAPQGAAPAPPGRHRTLPGGTARRPGMAVHLDQCATRVRHRLARLVSCGADTIAEGAASSRAVTRNGWPRGP